MVIASEDASNVLTAVLVGRAPTEDDARQLAQSACPYVGFYASQKDAVVGLFVLPAYKRWWIEYPQDHPEVLGLESATVLVTEKTTLSSPWSRGEVRPEATIAPCRTDCLTCPQYRVRCDGCPATIHFIAPEPEGCSACQEAAYVEGAVQWALEQAGSTEYAFMCYGFLEDAYELGNGIVLDGQGCSAKEAADAYGAQRDPEIPPRGAYVFYDCWGEIEGDYRNWGHIGLSLGDGQVIHAWDKVRVDGYLDIETLDAAPGWTKPSYLGWSPVEQVLQGMTISDNLTENGGA